MVSRNAMFTKKGSATELKYSLLTFGILSEGLILAAGEEDAKPELLQRYLQTRRDIEKRRQETITAEVSMAGITAFATRNDVLLGRGRPYQEFPGNQRLIELVNGEVERYRECKHLFEKTRVLLDVIAIVHGSGGHFLKRRTEGWEIAGDEMTMEKVRKTFLTRLRARLKGGSPDVTHNIITGTLVSGRSAKRLKVDPPGLGIQGCVLAKQPEHIKGV
jgi:hypothetical protein